MKPSYASSLPISIWPPIPDRGCVVLVVLVANVCPCRLAMAISALVAADGGLQMQSPPVRVVLSLVVGIEIRQLAVKDLKAQRYMHLRAEASKAACSASVPPEE